MHIRITYQDQPRRLAIFQGLDFPLCLDSRLTGSTAQEMCCCSAGATNGLQSRVADAVNGKALRDSPSRAGCLGSVPALPSLWGTLQQARHCHCAGAQCPALQGWPWR